MIEIDVRGALSKLRRATQILEPAKLLGEIGTRQLEWIRRNLRTGGAEARWPPMSPNTVVLRPQRASRSHFSGRFMQQLDQSARAEVMANHVQVTMSHSTQQLARLAHEGEGPQVIRPRRAAALHYLTAAQGWRSAREVRHPGTPARQLVPSARMGEELARAVLEAARQELRRG